MTLNPPLANRTWPGRWTGIYKLDGNQFTLCCGRQVDRTPAPRPRQFSARQGDLLVFRRETP